MPDELLKLPVQLQLALAGGYAAYLLAYVGIREHHTTVEVTFRSLIFSLIASGVYSILSYLHFYQVASVACAFLICCISGLTWRKYFRDWLRRLLRFMNISWSDDDPSALASLLANSANQMSQIAVCLDDGTWLMCNDLSKFESSPFGPCKLGNNGDVALYVTHAKSKGNWLSGAKWKAQTQVSSSFYGDNITYIPASKIKYVKFRQKS